MHGRTNQKKPWLDWLSTYNSRGVRTVYDVRYFRIWLVNAESFATVTSYQPAFGIAFQLSVGVSPLPRTDRSGRHRVGAR